MLRRLRESFHFITPFLYFLYSVAIIFILCSLVSHYIAIALFPQLYELAAGGIFIFLFAPLTGIIFHFLKFLEP